MQKNRHRTISFYDGVHFGPRHALLAALVLVLPSWDCTKLRQSHSFLFGSARLFPQIHILDQYSRNISCRRGIPYLMISQRESLHVSYSSSEIGHLNNVTHQRQACNEDKRMSLPLHLCEFLPKSAWLIRIHCSINFRGEGLDSGPPLVLISINMNDFRKSRKPLFCQLS